MATVEKVSCFPNEGTPQVIAGSPVDGDLVRITTPSGAVIYERYTAPAAPPGPRPLILSATAFQDVCETGLNPGGRARFGAIIRAMAASVDDDVLSVFKRYDKSLTFDKTKTSALLALLVSKGVANLTAQERTAVLAAWPEA